MKADLAASIHARLSARAKERGEVFQDVLTRYGVERFLYRLSRTPARDTLWLKGALLFNLWFDVPHRPTRDADFLGFGPSDQAALETERRRTPLPAAMPLGLKDQFGQDRAKQSQWSAFLAKNRLEGQSLDVVVREVRSFLEVPLSQASRQQAPV